MRDDAWAANMYKFVIHHCRLDPTHCTESSVLFLAQWCWTVCDWLIILHREMLCLCFFVLSVDGFWQNFFINGTGKNWCNFDSNSYLIVEFALSMAEEYPLDFKLAVISSTIRRFAHLCLCRHPYSLCHILYVGPHAGSGVVRIDPLRFLAGCRTRRLNQA